LRGRGGTLFNRGQERGRGAIFQEEWREGGGPFENFSERKEDRGNSG